MIQPTPQPPFFTQPPQSSFAAFKMRASMGLKFLFVCILALLMGIPGLFVDSLVDERANRSKQVAGEITHDVGGPQTFLGPTLLIPYTIPSTNPAIAPEQGIYFVSPATANATVDSTSQERRRAMFRVPVFQANVRLAATFDLTGVPANAPTGAQLDWTRAELVIGLSDVRAALTDATLSSGDGQTILMPARTVSTLSAGDGDHLHLTLFGAPAATLATPGAKFTMTSSLRVSGAQRLAVLAYGKSTVFNAQGDWHSPSFDGGFLPTQRNLSATGFTAQWSVPFMARGVRAEGPIQDILTIENTSLGVTFLESSDSYQSVTRSIKFILLFLGMVFLSYFVFETTTAKRVHPAQYVLVGVAQTIFYLLLLSLAERIGFDLAFLIAGTSTVALLSANAKWVFGSNREGLRAFGVFSLLYAMIYALLRLEDNALLVGAVASFVIVSIVMYATRNINWYSGAATTEPQPTA